MAAFLGVLLFEGFKPENSSSIDTSPAWQTIVAKDFERGGALRRGSGWFCSHGTLGVFQLQYRACATACCALVRSRKHDKLRARPFFFTWGGPKTLGTTTTYVYNGCRYRERRIGVGQLSSLPTSPLGSKLSHTEDRRCGGFRQSVYQSRARTQSQTYFSPHKHQVMGTV